MSKSNEKKVGEAKKARVNYLFSGYYDNSEKLVGEYRTLPGVTFFSYNTIVVEGQPKNDLVPFISNYNGAINFLTSAFAEGNRCRELTTGDNLEAKEQEVFFPSIEDLSYFYAVEGENWIKTIKEGVNQVKDNILDNNNVVFPKGIKNESGVKLKRVEVAFEQLEKPKSDKELMDAYHLSPEDLQRKLNLSEEDFLKEKSQKELLYRHWYEHQKGLILHGYLIKQSRYVVFTLSYPNSDEWELSFWPHNGNEDQAILVPFLTSEDDQTKKSELADSGMSVAIYQSTPQALPSGLYNIKIEATRGFGNKYWGDNFKDKKAFYLKEKFRFNLNNLAGDFEIINCDPITIEESLVKQFPLSYYHFVEQAYTQHKKKSGDAKAITIEQNLETIAHEIKINKSKMDFVRGAFDADTNNSKFQIIGKILAENLRAKTIDDSIIQSVDIAFQTADLPYSTFKNMRELMSHANGTNDTHNFKELLRQVTTDTTIRQNWLTNFSNLNSQDKKAAEKLLTDALDEIKFKKTLSYKVASKFQIPPEFMKKTMKGFGQLSKAVDLGMTFASVGFAYNNLTGSASDRDKKENDVNQLFLDYHQQVHQWTSNDSSIDIVKDDAQTFAADEKGEFKLTILFDSDKSDVKPSNIKLIQKKQIQQAFMADDVSTIASPDEVSFDQVALKKLLDFMTKHHDASLTLVGHTDPKDSPAYNDQLSEARANALKQYLIGQGINEDRLEVDFYGEERPVDSMGRPAYDKNGIIDYTRVDDTQSRRVEIIYHYFGRAQYLPSREGINNLEQIRDASVLAELKIKDNTAALASQTWNAIKATGAIIPQLKLASLIIIVADEVYGYGKNFISWMDSVFNESAIKTKEEQKTKLRSYNHASYANQRLLQRIIENERKTPNTMYLSSQYRIRSESLYGLVALLARASMGVTKDETYADRIKKYQIDAYIDNFILNDGWRFPLDHTFPISMDEFWLYAVNTEGLRGNENYQWFGFDINYRLTKNAKNSPNHFFQNLVQSFNKIGYAAFKINNSFKLNNILETGIHIYSYSSIDLPSHQKADFQSCFPIHHMMSKDVFQLSNTFQTDFQSITADDIEYTALYARAKNSKKDSDWQLMKDYASQNVVSPLDQIRIFVALKSGSKEKPFNSVYPATVQLNRIDGIDISGPVYKTLVRQLTEAELLTDASGVDESAYIGQGGFVLHPVFQFGQLTFCGTKPLATELGLQASGLLGKAFSNIDLSDNINDAYSYWRSGNLDDMRYEFVVTIGKSAKSETPINIADNFFYSTDEYSVSLGARHWQLLDYIAEATVLPKVLTSRHLQREFKWQAEALLLYSPFLSSRVKERETPPLFIGDPKICFLIRVGGEKGEYLMGVGDHIHTADKTYHRSCDIGGLTIRCHQSKLSFDDYNWDTPVEFIFIASSDDIDKKAYADQKLDHNKCSLSSQLVETSGSGTDGPLVNTSLRYFCQYKKGALNVRDKLPQFDHLNPDESKQQLSDPANNRYLISEPATDYSAQPELHALNNILEKQGALSAMISKFGYLCKKRYLYAAYHRCYYESLTGVIIDGIRPFSADRGYLTDRVSTNPSENSEANEYYDYEFKSVITGGRSIDLGDSSIINDYDAGRYLTSNDSSFSFSPPKNYIHNVPWVKEPDEAKELIEVEEKFNKESLYTKWHKNSDSEKLKQVKFWIEKDTHTLKQARLKAIAD